MCARSTRCVENTAVPSIKWMVTVAVDRDFPVSTTVFPRRIMSMTETRTLSGPGTFQGVPITSPCTMTLKWFVCLNVYEKFRHLTFYVIFVKSKLIQFIKQIMLKVCIKRSNPVYLTPPAPYFDCMIHCINATLNIPKIWQELLAPIGKHLSK